MYLVAPWADAVYFADSKWWQWHQDGIAKRWPWVAFTAPEVRARFAEFCGQKITIENTGMMISDPDVHMFRNGGREGLSEITNTLCTGSNSGYQALNLAVLAGAAKILLVGYDMSFPDGKSHSHNGHPVKVAETHYARFYADAFKSTLHALTAAGVSVINCNPNSKLKAYPFGDLDACLSSD